MPLSENAPLSCVLFDVDGTIVDTRELVHEAYALAGITMPPGAWGKPWHEWLVAECYGDAKMAQFVHGLKQEYYLEMLGYSRELKQLPPAEVAWLIDQTELAEVGFLTGASAEPAELILKSIGFEIANRTVGFGLTLDQKVDTIKMLMKTHTVSYVDDDQAAAREIGDRTGCSTIWYHGQTKDQLMADLWTQ